MAHVVKGVPGKLCTLSIDGALLAESETFTPTLNQAEIDVTNRDSDWWHEALQGLRDWEISGDGLYIFNDLAKKKLMSHYTTRSPATLTCILTLSDGTLTLEGECILTTISLPAPFADKATISFSLKGTGALTPTPAS